MLKKQIIKGFETKILKPFFSFLLIFVLLSCARQDDGRPRLGYLLNITHALPMVAIEEGLFDEYKLEHFVSGGYLLNSLMSGSIDIAYIGPGPYLNALDKGLKLELLDLSAVGANALVVSKEFKTKDDFVIHKLAVPQFGNTQDLLARDFVEHINSSQEKKSAELGAELMHELESLSPAKELRFADDLEYMAISPSELEMVLHKQSVDAALVAEPWATLLAQRGFMNLNAELDKKTLLNSLEDDYVTELRKDLKRMNTFPATLLVVRKEFFDANPRIIDSLVAKQDYLRDIISLDTESAIDSIQNHYKKIAGKSFSEELLIRAFLNIDFDSKLVVDKLKQLRSVAIAANYIKAKDSSEHILYAKDF